MGRTAAAGRSSLYVTQMCDRANCRDRCEGFAQSNVVGDQRAGNIAVAIPKSDGCILVNTVLFQQVGLHREDWVTECLKDEDDGLQLMRHQEEFACDAGNGDIHCVAIGAPVICDVAAHCDRPTLTETQVFSAVRWAHSPDRLGANVGTAAEPRLHHLLTVTCENVQDVRRQRNCISLQPVVGERRDFLLMREEVGFGDLP